MAPFAPVIAQAPPPTNQEATGSEFPVIGFALVGILVLVVVVSSTVLPLEGARDWNRSMKRSMQSAVGGLLAGLLAIAVGTLLVHSVITSGDPLIGGEEFRPAEGGELLEGGERAEPGELIKPSGTSIKGLAKWVFGVAGILGGLLVLGLNTVDLKRHLKRR